MTSPAQQMATQGLALHEIFGDLFTREYRTGREDEQYRAERVDDLHRILYELSYAEEARAIISHLNDREHARTITEIPECFVGQQQLYEAAVKQRKKRQAAGAKRQSWTFVSTPRPDATDAPLLLHDLVRMISTPRPDATDAPLLLHDLVRMISAPRRDATDAPLLLHDLVRMIGTITVHKQSFISTPSTVRFMATALSSQSAG